MRIADLFRRWISPRIAELEKAVAALLVEIDVERQDLAKCRATTLDLRSTLRRERQDTERLAKELVSVRDTSDTRARRIEQLDVENASIRRELDSASERLTAALEAAADRNVHEINLERDGQRKFDVDDAEPVGELTLEYETTAPAHVEIFKVAFDEKHKHKWYWTNGAVIFPARVLDETFLELVDSRDKGFFRGDVFHVHLHTKVWRRPDGRLKAEYAIREVIEAVPPHRQLTLTKLDPAPVREGEEPS